MLRGPNMAVIFEKVSLDSTLGSSDLLLKTPVLTESPKSDQPKACNMKPVWINFPQLGQTTVSFNALMVSKCINIRCNCSLIHSIPILYYNKGTVILGHREIIAHPYILLDEFKRASVNQTFFSGLSNRIISKK